MTPWLDDGDVQLYHGDVIATLASLPAGIAQTCVTSPPYWGLRDYGTGEWSGGDAECPHQEPATGGNPKQGPNKGSNNGNAAPYRDVCGRCGARRVDNQLGLEATPDLYVERLVAVFREVWRVLRADGTVWLNLGDSYASGNGGDTRSGFNERYFGKPSIEDKQGATNAQLPRFDRPAGLKSKDLVGVPWAVAKALQAPHYDGRIKAERDRVWLAATIDAEGSICGFHHTRKDDGSTRTGIHVTITNTNMPLLAEAQRIWPTSRDDGYAHGSSALGDRECRRWISVGVDDKALLLRELYPYLIAKRQQALLAWNFLEMSKVSKRIGKIAEGREAKGRRSWIVHALSALNRGDGIDVPNWIAEPPSLFQDGWYLRSDIVWSKPNPMPESVVDRPTKAHEYLFLLAKQPQYFMDMDAIRERADYFGPNGANGARPGHPRAGEMKTRSGNKERKPNPAAMLGQGDTKHGIPWEGYDRNRRSVWTIPTEPFPEAHFATYPQALVRPCILAGTSERGECVECGAPWVREVERVQGDATDRPKAVGQAGYGAPRSTLSLSGNGSKEWAERGSRNETIRWRPTCNHCLGASTGGQPQTVLDPFIGSGTTALVARNHGRRCIGIDLALPYLEIAARRLQQLSLLADPT